MNLTTLIATRNPCYKAGKSIDVKGIMLEGVGCPQASAKVFAHNRNREDCEGRCAHAFVDANDGSIIQILPWAHRGWHCGKHPRTKLNANNTHIGIQLCEPSQIRYKKRNQIELTGDKDKALAAVERVYHSAVELCAFLCDKFGLDPMTAIVSRKEGNAAAICSMNSSPEFVWEIVGASYTMDQFRKDVQEAMLNGSIAETSEETEQKVISQSDNDAQKDNLEDNCFNITNEPNPGENPGDDGAVKEESKLQMVRVTVDTLRVRSSPGIGNNTTGKFTGKGVFAITEIQNGSGSKLGWGKLENGAGWICLDYVEML